MNYENEYERILEHYGVEHQMLKLFSDIAFKVSRQLERIERGE